MKIAVLDTGVAYRNQKPGYAISPDFSPNQFLGGADFVAPDKLALDEDGHGTHIASTIGEQTGNGRGLTGLAYGAKLIPVRVLNADGEGVAEEIARGIRFATRHGAEIINMSFEFAPSVRSCAQINGICRAVRLANRSGALVVAASGNLASHAAAFPGRAQGVIAVGATTEGGCVAEYSNYGLELDLVAPGGRGELGTGCKTADRTIFQVTYRNGNRHSFGIPSGYMGTSMAAAHVSGVAAMVIASGILGADPSPERIECQIETTARKANLGQPYLQITYGAGLLDAAAAVRSPVC